MHVAAHKKEKEKENKYRTIITPQFLLRLCCVAEMFENLVTYAYNLVFGSAYFWSSQINLKKKNKQTNKTKQNKARKKQNKTKTRKKTGRQTDT